MMWIIWEQGLGARRVRGAVSFGLSSVTWPTIRRSFYLVNVCSILCTFSFAKSTLFFLSLNFFVCFWKLQKKFSRMSTPFCRWFVGSYRFLFLLRLMFILEKKFTFFVLQCDCASWNIIFKTWKSEKLSQYCKFIFKFFFNTLFLTAQAKKLQKIRTFSLK